MNETLRLQWERLCNLIAPSGGPITDRKLLLFAEAHRLDDSQQINLLKLRAGIEEIDFKTVTKLCRLHPTIKKEWLLGIDDMMAPMNAQELIGSWRLFSVRTLHDGWKITPGWGPGELVFRCDQTVEIVQQHQIRREKYYLLSGRKELVVGETVYNLLELRDDLLELSAQIDNEKCRFAFKPIPEQDVHWIPASKASPWKIGSCWIISQQEEFLDGAWTMKNDYTADPGLWLWQFKRQGPHDRLFEARFAFRLQLRDFLYDDRSGILAVRVGKIGRKYYYFCVDDQDHAWAYVLNSPLDDFRDSTVRYHLKGWNSYQTTPLRAWLRWAELNILTNKPADKTPFNMLNMCRSSHPERIARLIDSGDLLANPDLYTEDEYVGAYIFLHVYMIYVKTISCAKLLPLSISEAYLQFQATLGWWLDGRKQHSCEYYPFNIPLNAALYEKLKDRMTDRERLETIMKAEGFHTHSFARKIGLPRAEPLYRIKRGEDALSLDIAEKICHTFPNYSKQWLLTGMGDPTT